jgi:AbrB family looped-hinge helix DNA binding protein
MTGEVKKKMFGTVTVGERGQIVIPADIRTFFKISPGDKLIILAKNDDMIGIVSVEKFHQFFNEVSEVMTKINKR